MDNQISNYQCPACMGPLHFVGSTGKLECDYCGSGYTVEEVEKLMAEADQKAADAKIKADNSQTEKSEEWECTEENWVEEGMKSYSCPSCGAELVCDENMAAGSCPYCGNTSIVPGQFNGMLKPDYVIPFKVDKEAAIEGLKSHYKGKLLLPKSFTNGNHIDEIKGVYVPYWLYDGVVSGGAVYKAEKKHVKRNSKEEQITTEHYRVSRSGTLEFHKVPADGSSKMPDDLMDSIEPFDYSEMKEFSKAYMAGYLADKYDVTAQENQSRIELRVKNTFQDMLRDTVNGYDTVVKDREKTHIENGQISYAMLPVWILNTKWNNKNFTFAMNGQSGKMVGDLPVDKSKYWMIVIGLTIALEVIMMAVSGFSFAGLTLAKGVIKYGIIPLAVSFLVGAILKGSMKDVREATQANSYVDKNGLKLTLKQDHFVRKTEEKRKLEN